MTWLESKSVIKRISVFFFFFFFFFGGGGGCCLKAETKITSVSVKIKGGGGTTCDTTQSICRKIIIKKNNFIVRFPQTLYHQTHLLMTSKNSIHHITDITYTSEIFPTHI